jgi:hypothetical protein
MYRNRVHWNQGAPSVVVVTPTPEETPNPEVTEATEAAAEAADSAETAAEAATVAAIAAAEAAEAATVTSDLIAEGDRERTDALMRQVSSLAERVEQLEAAQLATLEEETGSGEAVVIEEPAIPEALPPSAAEPMKTKPPSPLVRLLFG